MFFFVALSLESKTPRDAFKRKAQCGICKRIRELSKRDQTSSLEEFKKYSTEKCATLPDETRGLCMILSSDWAQYIREAETDEKACDFACENVFRTKSKPRSEVKARKAKMMEPLSLLPCDACVTIVDISMSLAPDYLGNFDINIFQSACRQITMFEDRCHLFTDQVFADVIQYVLSNLAPYELCVQYGMC